MLIFDRKMKSINIPIKIMPPIQRRLTNYLEALNNFISLVVLKDKMK